VRLTLRHALIPLVAFSGTLVAAQAPTSIPSFDIISIHPSDPNMTTEDLNFRQDEVEGKGLTLSFLIQSAYNIHDFQISGIPHSLEAAKYDILAKMDDRRADIDSRLANPRDSKEQQQLTRQRLRSLLATRFGLQMHTTMQRMPVLALVVAKGGSKLKPAVAQEDRYLRNQTFTHKMQTDAKGMTMAAFADDLGFLTHRIVQDRTALADSYDFTLTYTAPDDTNPDPATPSLYTALQEQLGLKLIPTTGPVMVYRIDHLTSPSPN
jgi:bla regulator protein blaR1